MSVLMISPNRFRPVIAPLGLEYVCNSLDKNDIEFDVVDLNFAPEHEVDRILKSKNVEMVGISVRNVDSAYCIKNEFFIPRIRSLVQRIKNSKDCEVVLGGAGFSILPEEIMRYTGADFGVAGYGEDALPALLGARRAKGDLSRVNNLLYLKNGHVVRNQQTKGIHGKLGGRCRGFVDNAAYYRTSGMGNIETKRGCTMACGYCTEPRIVGHDVCHNEVRHVVEELKALRQMGIDYVHFCDSEFNVGSYELTRDLLQEMIVQNVGMNYTTFMHPHPRMMSEEFVGLLKSSGCREITLSVDSGADLMLQRWNKGHSRSDVVYVSALIKKYGIRLVHSYLFGGPGEDFSTLDQSIDLMKTCAPDMSLVYAGVRIYPGTDLARTAVEEGVIKTDADLLVPVFYRPERALCDFIPYLRRKTKGMKNCVMPIRGVDFVNMLVQQIYMSGFRGPFSEFIDEARRIPIKQKAKIMGKTLVEWLFS